MGVRRSFYKKRKYMGVFFVKLSQVTEMSDGEFMLADLDDLGYWATSTCLDAIEYASPVPRIRAWWGGIEGIHSSHAAEAQYFFSRLLKAFKLSVQTPITDVLVKSEHTRRMYADKIGVALVAGTGMRQARSQEKNAGDTKWKEYHAELYDAILNMQWPLSEEAISSEIEVDGMTRREADAAFFMNRAFEMEHEQEFVNINPDLLMLLAGVLEYHSEEKAQELGRKYDIKKSVWKPVPGTLIGSCKIVCRYNSNSKTIVRCWENFEYMSAIGWHIESWAPRGMQPRSDPAAIQDFNECISCLAGNAFCLYHFAPFELSLLATAGKFRGLQPQGSSAVPACVEDSASNTLSDDDSADGDSC